MPHPFLKAAQRSTALAIVLLGGVGATRPGHDQGLAPFAQGVAETRKLWPPAFEKHVLHLRSGALVRLDWITAPFAAAKQRRNGSPYLRLALSLILTFSRFADPEVELGLLGGGGELGRQCGVGPLPCLTLDCAVVAV